MSTWWYYVGPRRRGQGVDSRATQIYNSMNAYSMSNPFGYPNPFQSRARRSNARARTSRREVRNRRQYYSYKDVKYSDDANQNDITEDLSQWDVANQIVPATATNNFVGVQQGTAVNQRIGERIYVKNIQWKFRIQAVEHHEIGAAPKTTAQYDVHFFIILDRDMPGTAPVFTDIYENAAAGYPLMDRPRKMDYIRRFKVLKHHVVQLNRQATITHDGTSSWRSTIAETIKAFKIRLTFKKPLCVEYKTSSTGRTDSDIDRNGIYVLA